MKVTINAKKTEVSENIKVQIEKKLMKFERIFPGLTDANVKLSVEPDNLQRVEVTIIKGPYIFRSEKKNKTFLNALDDCVDAIERQIRKNKTKLQKNHREKIISIEEVQNDDSETDQYDIRFKKFSIKPMTVDEAILQMNLLEHDFYVYNDSETQKVCVVYKRHNNSYGVIETE